MIPLLPNKDLKLYKNKNKMSSKTIEQ